VVLKGVGKSRNAGEWAELYVLLNTLADGELYAADGDLNIIPNQYFPVIKIKKKDSVTGRSIEYTIDRKNKNVKVTSDDKFVSSISMKRFRTEADDFFKIISTRKSDKLGPQNVFKVTEISAFMEQIQNPEIKQTSSNKADIHMIIHDIMTGFEQLVGFSIKSKFKSAATLLNPSGQTLFQYRIKKSEGFFNKTDVMAALSPSIGGPQVRMKRLFELGYELQFVQVKGASFKENLTIIDSSLSTILAECLRIFFSSSNTSLKKVVDVVSQNNPCKYNSTSHKRLMDHYVYKVKRLIVDASLGMVPSKPWEGKYDASGGYLVVKKMGEVVCYHLYSWNALQDYLYNNLRFEGPPSTDKGSKKSYNYALHYEDNDESFVDLCLQIRFK